MLAGGCGDHIESVFAGDGEPPCSRGAPLSGESGAVAFMSRPIAALSPAGGRGDRMPVLACKRCARGTESNGCPVEDTVGRGGEEIRYPVREIVGGSGVLIIVLRESGACGISLEPAGGRGDRTEPMLAGGCGDHIEPVFAGDGDTPCSRGAPLSGESSTLAFTSRPIVALSPAGGRGDRMPVLAGKRQGKRCARGAESVGRVGTGIRHPVEEIVGGGGALIFSAKCKLLSHCLHPFGELA